MEAKPIFQAVVEHKHDGEEHSHEDEDNQQLLIAKGTAMLVLFIATIALGTLPFQLSKWFKWFDKNELALLMSEDSRFNKLVSRKPH